MQSGKVMRLNRPNAIIHFLIGFESAFNRLFDLTSSPDLIKIVATIRIQTQILNLNLIYIKNWLNLIENGRKRIDFIIFVVIFDKNGPFLSFNQLFGSLY